MKRPLTVRLITMTSLRLMSGLCILVLCQGSPVLAEVMPPFPVVYGGRALLDGEPLPRGTRLVARVLDYEIWTFVEDDGGFRNLVVGPPNRDYYNLPVTFHALDLVAVETDVFRTSDAPVFKDLGSDLHFSRLTGDVVPELPSALVPAVETSTPPTRSDMPEVVNDQTQIGVGGRGGYSAVRLLGGAVAILGMLVVWLVLRRKWTG